MTLIKQLNFAKFTTLLMTLLLFLSNSIKRPNKLVNAVLSSDKWSILGQSKKFKKMFHSKKIFIPTKIS